MIVKIWWNVDVLLHSCLIELVCSAARHTSSFIDLLPLFFCIPFTMWTRDEACVTFTKGS